MFGQLQKDFVSCQIPFLLFKMVQKCHFHLIQAQLIYFVCLAVVIVLCLKLQLAWSNPNRAF